MKLLGVSYSIRLRNHSPSSSVLKEGSEFWNHQAKRLTEGGHLKDKKRMGSIERSAHEELHLIIQLQL